MLARERRHVRQTLVDRIGAHAAKGARDLREVSIDLRAADDSPFDERRLARPMIRRIGDAGQTISGGRGNLDRAADRCPMQQTCGRPGNGGGIKDEFLHARELLVGHDAAREYRAERSGMKFTCESPVTEKQPPVYMTASRAHPSTLRPAKKSSGWRRIFGIAIFADDGALWPHSHSRSGNGRPARSAAVSGPSAWIPMRSSTAINCRQCCAECQVTRSKTLCADVSP